MLSGVVGVNGLRTDGDNNAVRWRVIQGGIESVTVHMSPFSCYFLSVSSTLLFTALLSITIYLCYSLLLREIFHIHRKCIFTDIYTTLDWISAFGVLGHFHLSRTKQDDCYIKDISYAVWAGLSIKQLENAC